MGFPAALGFRGRLAYFFGAPYIEAQAQHLQQALGNARRANRVMGIGLGVLGAAAVGLGGYMFGNRTNPNRFLQPPATTPSSGSTGGGTTSSPPPAGSGSAGTTAPTPAPTGASRGRYYPPPRPTSTRPVPFPPSP